MQVTVLHREQRCFAGWSNGRRVIIDLPSTEGGTDQGMTPSELFIAALGACIADQVANYCRLNNIVHEGMNVRLEWMTSNQPQRIYNIRAQINLPSKTLTLEQEASLLGVARRGLLSHTLRYSPALDVELNLHECAAATDADADESTADLGPPLPQIKVTNFR